MVVSLVRLGLRCTSFWGAGFVLLLCLWHNIIFRYRRTAAGLIQFTANYRSTFISETLLGKPLLFVVWAGQRIKPFGIIFCFLWTTNSTVFLDKAVLLLSYWRDSILISCGGVCGCWCNLLPNEIFIFSRPCIFLCLIISWLFLPHLRCDRYSRAIAVLGFLSDSFNFQLNFVGVFSSARPSLVYSPCVRLPPVCFPPSLRETTQSSTGGKLPPANMEQHNLRDNYSKNMNG